MKRKKAEVAPTNFSPNEQQWRHDMPFIQIQTAAVLAAVGRLPSRRHIAGQAHRVHDKCCGVQCRRTGSDRPSRVAATSGETGKMSVVVWRATITLRVVPGNAVAVRRPSDSVSWITLVTVQDCSDGAVILANSKT